MTIQTQFVSWQTHPKTPDPKRCSPLNTTLRDYLLGRWGGMNLGCYNPRPVTTGKSPSTHWSGAANDWRYADPGGKIVVPAGGWIGRQRMLDEVMPWLIDNSLELGVQAVHDYAGRRIWRPPGCSGRPTQPSPECGWRPASSEDMNPANTWLHIEVLPSRWSDTRTVEQMLGPEPPEPPDPPQPPTPGVFTVQGYRSEVVQGSSGKMAKMCQQQINLIAAQGIAEDGNFGPQSVAALKNVQTVLKVNADGECGPKTWQAFEDGIKTQAEAGTWD